MLMHCSYFSACQKSVQISKRCNPHQNTAFIAARDGTLHFFNVHLNDIIQHGIDALILFHHKVGSIIKRYFFSSSFA